MTYHPYFTNPYPFSYEKRPKYPPSFFPSSSSSSLTTAAAAGFSTVQLPTTSTPPATPHPVNSPYQHILLQQPHHQQLPLPYLLLRHLHHRHASSNSPGFTSGHQEQTLPGDRSQYGLHTVGHGGGGRGREGAGSCGDDDGELGVAEQPLHGLSVRPVAELAGQLEYTVAGGEARGAGGGTPVVEMPEGVWPEEKIQEGELQVVGSPEEELPEEDMPVGRVDWRRGGGRVDVVGSWMVEKLAAAVEEEEEEDGKNEGGSFSLFS